MSWVSQNTDEDLGALSLSLSLKKTTGPRIPLGGFLEQFSIASRFSLTKELPGHATARRSTWSDGGRRSLPSVRRETGESERHVGTTINGITEGRFLPDHSFCWTICYSDGASVFCVPFLSRRGGTFLTKGCPPSTRRKHQLRRITSPVSTAS